MTQRIPPHQKDQKFHNWGQNINAVPEIIWEPETLDDLIYIVKEANVKKRRIRAVGDGHSWSPLWWRGRAPDGWIVKSSKINHVKVHEDLTKLTVGCGASIEQLMKAEIKHRVCIPTSVVLTAVLLGGVVSTGSHGTGYNQPIIGDYVHSITMVMWDGTMKVLSKEDGEVFEAAKCSLGSFGLIYEITFNVVPQPVVHVQDKKLKISEVFDRADPSKIKELVLNNDYVEIFWFPLNKQGELWVKLFNYAPGKEPHNTPCEAVGNLMGWAQAQYAKWVALVEGKIHPSAVTKFSTEFQALLDSQDTYQDLSWAMHFQPELEVFPPTDDTEVAFKIDSNFSNVVEAFLGIIELTERYAANGKYPLNLVLECRFLKNTQQLLSPGYEPEGSDVHHCYLEIESYANTQHYNEFARDCFIPWFTKHPSWKALPHWPKNWQVLNDPGQSFSIDRYLRATYGENLVKFAQIRDKIDPHRIFLNNTLEDLLYPDEVEELTAFHSELSSDIKEIEQRLKAIQTEKVQLAQQVANSHS